MMYRCVSIVLVCLAVASDAALMQKDPSRGSSNCNELAVPNVCPAGLLSSSLRLPHPTDSGKFLMCGPGGRMYIVSCPPGEKYEDSKKDCGVPQTPAPTMNPYNPCTAANIAALELFFPYPGDNTRYIKCLGVGTPSVLNCLQGYMYDPTKAFQGCVTATPTLPVTTIPTTQTAPYNPCNLMRLGINNLFFTYKADRTKFIHCDLTGAAHVMQCPEGLVWSQTARSCIESVISGR